MDLRSAERDERGRAKSGPTGPQLAPRRARDEAAKAAGASPRGTQRAKRVREHRRQLVGQAAAAGDVELAIAALAAGGVRPLTALPGLARELAEAQGPAEFAAVLEAPGGTNELRPRARR
jgi:hypothetical protein